MIAVIADDITGAAELGGIGLRHRLVTEVRTAVGISGRRPDLLIIAADTRSKDEEAAVKDMELITWQLLELRPDWIYKKTDSVLRGHVVAEIRAQLKVLGFDRTLLIPANPALGRTISNGHYFLNGRPVHESAFSADPEFPIKSSLLQDMLHAPVDIRTLADDLPARGLVVGEVEDSDDLHAWAERVEPGTLLAGASGFFSALLDEWKINGQRQPVVHPMGSPKLYVSGTTFDHHHKHVTYRPETVIQRIREQGKALMAVDPVDRRSAFELRTAMARDVNHILQQVNVAELIIEGGSTAYAILDQAGFHTFIPEEELAPGVVRMSLPDVPGLFVTVKPGSYRWPPSIQFAI